MSAFLLEGDAAVTTITFNRPERRNGLNAAVLDELEELVRQVRDDRRTRALILTGAGTVFCAGAEPASVAERGASGASSGGRGGPRVIGRVFDLIAHLDLMTIVAVNGHAVGGGWSLALAADYCLAVPAAEFWVPEVDLGVPFRGLPSFALTHRMGPWLAKEAAILCRRFTAGELHHLGSINQVVEPDQLMAEARRIAERYAAQPARAANLTKRDINSVIYGPRHH
jgi:2-(1,2-epoxy-1,2-dihydrophenyl)acetyl-CoA isomerase